MAPPVAGFLQSLRTIIFIQCVFKYCITTFPLVSTISYSAQLLYVQQFTAQVTQKVTTLVIMQRSISNKFSALGNFFPLPICRPGHMLYLSVLTIWWLLEYFRS